MDIFIFSKVCKFWSETGVCKFGSKCKYSHDVANENRGKQKPLNDFENKRKKIILDPIEICQHFKSTGRCKYGSDCKYSHDLSKEFGKNN